MFNKGDLVKVKSHSIIKYSVQNRVQQKMMSYGSRQLTYQVEPEVDLYIEYYPEPHLLADKQVGEVLDHVRMAFYTVKLADRTVICFPDELELVYTV